MKCNYWMIEFIPAAQDLLQHWVAEKLHFDTELEFTDETWNQQKTEAEIKREWDHLVADDDEMCFDGLESGILNHSHIKAKLQEDGKSFFVWICCIISLHAFMMKHPFTTTHDIIVFVATLQPELLYHRAI